MDTSYRPLSENQQQVLNSQVLASGEANFADFSDSFVNSFLAPILTLSGQRPHVESGINARFEEVSGLLALEDPRVRTNNDRIIDDLLFNSGILSSAMSPFFDFNKFSSSFYARKNDVSLSDFSPCVHYYPKNTVRSLSLYTNTTLAEPYLMYYYEPDPSGVKKPYIYGFSVDKYSEFDPGVTDLFTDEKLINPEIDRNG
jgi:hypothetical protein